MKRLITLIIVFLSLTGCTDSRQGNYFSDEPLIVANTSPNEELLPTYAGSSSFPLIESLDAKAASFFFPNTDIVTYRGSILFDGDSMDVFPILHVFPKENNENLYELVLDKIDSVPDDRLSLGYFYVDGKTIYRLKTSTERSGVITQEDILKNGDIVCNDKPIIDNQQDEGKGIHYKLDVYDGKCESNYYNNQVETGYYETFVWELGKGLVEYSSGFGAERDSMHIIMK